MKKLLISFTLSFFIFFFSLFFLYSCKTTDISLSIPDDISRLFVKSIYEERDLNPLYRELRGAWFSTVVNIDWPVKDGDEQEQKKIIIEHLDKLLKNNFNAVFVQVKPDAGVIYPSKINPVTRYFLGLESTNESDDYPFKIDMFEYIINEAHKRNIEVHAWINPYRLSLTYDTNKSYEEQFSKKNFVHTYVSNGLKPIYWADGRLYLDPGEPLSAKYVIDSTIEIVEKYDIDGIHFDDYFYQNTARGKTFKDWPDEESAKKHAASLGYDYKDKGRDDYGRKGLYAWRRRNINDLVSKMYEEIKKRKPYVKWTISPAGIWRNNEPLSYIPGDKNGSDTKGYNVNFDSLHADVLLWLLNGEKTSTLLKASEIDGLCKMYIDALIPQIYWTDKNKSAPFDVLLDWWVREAKKSLKNRADIYIGHALYRMGGPTNVEPWQTITTLSDQVKYIRKKSKNLVKGSVFFTLHNMYYNDRDTKDFGALAISNIVKTEYIFPAIVPKMNTMKDLENFIKAPENPKMKLKFNSNEISFTDPNGFTLDKYGCPKAGTSVYYTVYRESIGGYGIEIVAKIRRENIYKNSKVIYRDKNILSGKTYIYYVTALDRLHNESSPLKIRYEGY